MIKVIEHRGELYLQIEGEIQSVTDHKGTTSFVKIGKDDFEKLAFELWAEAMDKGLKRITS